MRQGVLSVFDIRTPDWDDKEHSEVKIQNNLQNNQWHHGLLLHSDDAYAVRAQV